MEPLAPGLREAANLLRRYAESAEASSGLEMRFGRWDAAVEWTSLARHAREFARILDSRALHEEMDEAVRMETDPTVVVK